MGGRGRESGCLSPGIVAGRWRRDGSRGDYQRYPSARGVTHLVGGKSGNDRNVDYTLIDVFALGGLWERQLLEDATLQKQSLLNPISTSTYHRWGAFKGDKGGGCGKGATVTCSENAANLPWGWDDDDDGKVYRGELALDPAHVVSQYFTGLGNFSRQYLCNAYLSSLKSHGYHQNKTPRGWPSQISLGGLLATLTPACR